MKKIRLIFSFLLVLSFVGGSAFATKIPQSKALEIASSFFQKSGRYQQHMAVLRTSEDLPSLSTKADPENPRYYVVGNSTGKGFVIVSADDRFCPILGYSMENNFNEEDLPSNVENWFLFLRKQMDWAEENNITDAAATAAWKEESKVGTTVKYLQTPSWRQGDPFNLQCPLDGTSRCITGCVATAVSEVMRYHKWPESGKGTTTAYKGSNGNKVSVAARDLNHAYNWDKMPYTTSEYDTDEEKNAVSTLLADVGAALQLNYGKSSTGGIAVNPCLITNFGYSSSMYTDYRDNYNMTQWVELLKNEIDNNRPIIYDGEDDNGDGGHCFVLDGYNSENYFHANWGWNGSYNGYFLISALNPDDYKFNSDQDAIFGFKPGDWTTTNPDHWLDLYTPGLQCSATTFTKNKSFNISLFRYTNTSALDFKGTVALLLVDKTGNIIESLLQQSVSFEAGKYLYSGYTSISVTITSDIKPGYRIRAFYKPYGVTTWSPMWKGDAASSSMVQEILVAEDIDTPLDEATSFYYDENTKKITLATQLENVTATLYNSEGEVVTDGTSFNCPTFVIDMSKLTEGKYKIKLVKGNEVKELEFSVTTTK